ncbi:MAG: DUF4352 domain-containing protein [Acidimicrobiales bacterium]
MSHPTTSTPAPPPPPPPSPSVPLTHKEVNAAAKAEKARAKALRPWFKKKRFWVLGVAAVLIIAAIAGSAGGSKKATTATNSGTTVAATATTGANGGTTPGGQDVYAIGQTAHSSDLDVTLNTVKDPFTSTNQFDRPSTGQRYVATEITVKNTGKSKVTVSSLLNAELTDSQARPWTITIGGVDLPRVDGDVQPGESRRGWMVFGVDQAASGLRLRFKGSITATGSVFTL